MLDPASRQRLIKLLGMGSSVHDGERASALALADKLLRDHKTSWAELFGGVNGAPAGLIETIRQLQHRLDIAIQACQELQTENDQLRHDLARAAKAAAGNVVNVYALGDVARQAQWVLGLAENGAVVLTEWEHDFCTTVAGWEGELTPKQRPSFARLLQKVQRRTGRAPP
jgi:hypothetical protein